jgi:hypothetical protein
MAEYAYPKALTGMQDLQWSNFIMKLIEDGATSDTSFVPSANGSGMNASLTAGNAVVQGVLTGNDSSATVTIAAAPAAGSGLSRIDTIVKRLDRTGTPVIQTAVLTGTPSASPSPKALTQETAGIWEWPVADVLVVTGTTSIAADKITDRRTFSTSGVTVWATRPAAPRKGRLGFNTSLGKWEWFDGSTWTDLVPSSHDINGTGHTGTLSIARGGTGATSAMAALNALGIYIQPTEPANAPNRVWIRTSA